MVDCQKFVGNPGKSVENRMVSKMLKTAVFPHKLLVAQQVDSLFLKKVLVIFSFLLQSATNAEKTLMQNKTLIPRTVLVSMGCLSLCCLSYSALGAEAAANNPQSALNREATQHPVNLARSQRGIRLSVFNAQGQPTGGNASAATALLSDSDPLGYALESGRTTMILALSQTEEVHLFNFLNLSAAGQVSVSVSNSRLAPGAPQWRSVVNAQEFSAHDVINCELGSAEARYVKLDFQVTTAGRIDTFGLYGNRTVSAFGSASDQAAGDRFLGYQFIDYGGAAAPGTVVAVSPGDDLNAAQSIVDGNLKTSYTFKATDGRPLAVIDLGTARTIRRVSIAYKAGPGRLDFYLVVDPSQQRNGFLRARNTSADTAAVQQIVGSNFPGSRTPIATVRSTGESGLQRANVNATGENGRYMVMIFTPGGGSDAGGGASNGGPNRRNRLDVKDFDAKDFKDVVPPSGANASEPFAVSELSFIGPPGSSTEVVPQLPPGSTVPLFPPGGAVTP
ncbi:MAG: hypothetical protein JO295_13185 [Verrucomicrobia bacterium]|nr:hypothetical protein [Verrucomicrobiota bacterium]